MLTKTYYAILGLILSLLWIVLAIPVRAELLEMDLLLCPNDTIIATAPGLCSTVMNDIAPEFLVDPSMIDTFYYKINNGQTIAGDASGSSFSLGTHTLVYFAKSGLQTDSCSFKIKVEDQENPIIDCPQEVSIRIDGTVLSDPDHLLLKAFTDSLCSGIIIYFAPPTGTDNCDNNLTLLQTNGLVAGSVFSLGTHQLAFQLVDEAGNTGICEFNIKVLPIEEVAVQIAPDAKGCEGDLVQLVPGALVGFSYAWIGPNNFTSTEISPAIYISPETIGTYWVACTNSKGCTTIGNIDLEMLANPQISAASNSPVCDGQLELTGTQDSIWPLINHWEWQGPCAFQSTSADTMISDLDANCAGTYTLTATSVDGCQTEVQTNVSILELPQASIQSACAISLCLGESCSLIGTDFQPSPEAYLWSSSDAEAGLPDFRDQAKINITPTRSGIFTYTYSVIIGGCESESTSITIEVNDLPEAVDDEYQIASGQLLEGMSPSDNDQFNTNNPFSIELLELPQNGILTPQTDGTFTYLSNLGFSGVDQFSYQICQTCKIEICEEAQVTIQVTYEDICFIPTIITPNGDQTNDRLRIPCLENEAYPQNTLVIFNQWGDKVFEAAPYQNDWEGTWQNAPGKNLPDGTYFYNFKRDENSQIVKGHLLVYR